jgi:hypothetical protein
MGLLELRYSPTCKANWGRFTVWGKTGWSYTHMGTSLYPRVTVWNPGGPSFGVAHLDMSMNQDGSTWSKMTDGKPTACTGVEVLESNYTIIIGLIGSVEIWTEKKSLI